MTQRRRPRLSSVLGRATALLVLLGTVLAGGALPAQAADLSGFNPGLIISDANFTNSSAMSAADVQAFLDARGQACRPGDDGSLCLKDARFDTPSRAADDRCTQPYNGTGNESVAQIITKVAVSCGISPRVLLVMLQKEQGLVTATRNGLTQGRYRIAMGFGCPDTAACDTRYYGFFNQVYQASWQLKNYALNPTRYAHRAGVVNQVRFHPNASCGSSPVLIQNQATASLYNYTPYQPNAAALAAGYGTGDACSSYGNRNFYSYYADWFGFPNGLPPIGVVDAATGTNTGSTTGIQVSGWSLDPDTSESNQVHLYLDGAGTAVVANQSRPDVAAAYGRGDKHGFSQFLAATPGAHSLCTFGISVGPGENSLLDCRTVVVPDSAPIGGITSVTTTTSGVTITGWTLDPDTWESNQAHIYIDGVGVAVQADQSRPDIAAAYGRGDRHGFTHTRTLSPGAHSVCVFGINTAAGANTLIDCRTVNVADSVPIGVIDAVTATATGVTISGWALDPDTTDPNQVHIYIDGVGVALWADQSRPDVNAVYGRGDRHGFTHTRNLGPGPHSVCVYSINTGPGDNAVLGCRSFTVADAPPVGAITNVAVTSSGVTVSGWTLDPDSADRIQAHVYIDGVGAAIWADQPSPGRTDNHGFSHARNLGPGAHSVCVYGISANGGANTLLGCRSFTVADQAPIGVIDSVTVDAGQVTVSGWTMDPDTSEPNQAHLYIDGVGAAIWADLSRPDVAAVYGNGDRHGYAHTRPITSGAHSVCVYGITSGTGDNTLLGCRAFTAP